MLRSALARFDRWSAVAAAAVLLGCGLIAVTIPGHSQTFDEGVHVAAGVEWLERGTYTLERHHTPLTRIPVAIGPYLDGVRVTPGFHDFSRRMWSEGDSVFFQGKSYTRTLTIARLGTLPFYLLLTGVVWLWGVMLLGRPGAAIATALAALTPPILGHAGLATTDAGLAATVVLAVYAFIRWLEAPSARRAALFGAASALALTAKLSALPYIGLCMVFFTAWRLWRHRRTPEQRPEPGGPSAYNEWRTAAPPQLAASIAACFLVIWAVYRFSFLELGGIHIPAGEFLVGVVNVARHGSTGHASYLLGERSMTGWWYYFPVVIAVKTPLVLLFLGLVGAVVSLRQTPADWRVATPVLLVAAVLATGIITGINIGVRHILPLYAAWAVLAAIGTLALWRPGRALVARRVLVSAGLAWFTIDVVRETPHHLAYFNELSRRDPGSLLVDSNLDWGQDMLRLSEELSERGISDVSVSMLTRPVFGRLTTARVRNLRPRERASGWLAVSETCLHGVYPMLCGPFDWLGEQEPVARVGRSILLYHVSGTAARLGPGVEARR